MAESPPSMNRTSSLEHSHSGGFSEAMFYLKRAAVLKRKAEPGYSFCQHKHYCKAANRSNKLHCDCGETRDEPLAWHWDRVRATQVTFRANHVVCHETLSTGTALLLGDTPLEPGGHHFFEVKLLTDLYGTDTMIGLCTDRLEPSVGEQRFVSLLGSDQHSWGFSYHGKAQHAGAVRTYGAEFGKGSIVGVYANLRSGHLEFFLNRRSLGVAFTGLPCGAGERLYPAFCTTAANTCVRLVTAVSVPDSLQFQTTAIITRSIPRWSLSLPAPICRLVRRFAWLEYRQPHLPATGDDAVMLLDDSPAQQTSRPPPLPLPPAASEDALDVGGDLLSICGAVGAPVPPAWYLDDDDSPPAVAVVSRVAPGGRAPAAVPPPARRLRLYVSPDEQAPLARGAAGDGERPGDDASPPLRTPVALVTLVPTRRGRRPRRSSAAAPLSRPPVAAALSRPPADAPTPTCSDELLNVAMVSSPDEPEPESPIVRRALPDRDSSCGLPMPNGDSDGAAPRASGACKLVGHEGRPRDAASVLVSMSGDDANGTGDQSATAAAAPLGSLTGGLIPQPCGPVADVNCDVPSDVRVTDDLDTAVISDMSSNEPPIACDGDTAVISDMANGDSKVTSDADTAVITGKSSGELTVACAGDTAVISDMANGDSKVNCDGDDVEPTVRCDGDTVTVSRDASHSVEPTITCGGDATAAVDVTSHSDIKAPCDRNTSAVLASQPSTAASRVTIRRGRRSSVSGGTAAAGGSGRSDVLPAGTAAGPAIQLASKDGSSNQRASEDQSTVRSQGIISEADISHSIKHDHPQLCVVRCDTAVQPVLRVVDPPSPAESPILGGRASVQQTVRDAPPPGLDSVQQTVLSAPPLSGPERPRQGRRVSARLAAAPLPVSAVAEPGAAGARDSGDGTLGSVGGAHTEGSRPSPQPGTSAGTRQSPQPGTSAGTRPSLIGTSARADGTDRRCFTIAEESNGDIASSVTTRRRSVVATIASSSDVSASTKTRRRSAAVLSISTSDTATNAKTRRRSTAVFSIATSDVKAASPKTRRRSAVPSMGGSDAAKAAVGRRRSALPSTTSTDVAVDDVKTRRRSVVSTESSIAETVPVTVKARRRSTAPSGSSDGVPTVAAMDTTGRRRSVVPTPSTSSSDAAADLKPTRGRRLSLVPSEGSTDAADDAKTRRRSAAPSTGSSDLATAAKTKRRSVVPTEVIASELAVPAKNRRRSAVHTEATSELAVLAKNRRRSAAPASTSGTAAVSEIDATARPTRGRRLSLATSEGSNDAIDVMKTRRRSAVPSLGISEVTAAAKTRRRSALPSSEDTSDVAVRAKTRRRSAVPSDIGSDAAATVKSTFSMRRLSTLNESTSDVAVPAKTRRRSAVPSEGTVSEITVPTKTRRRSAAPSISSSDTATDASTLNRRSAVSNEDSSDVTVPTSSRRRWSVAGGSSSDADPAKIRLRLVVDAETDSDAKTAPAKTRRRSAAILSESSSDIVVPAAKTRRRSAIGIQSSDDVADPVKRRRRSAVASGGSGDVSAVVASEYSSDAAAEVPIGISSDAAVKTRRRSSVGSGRNSEVAVASAAAADATATSSDATTTAAPSDVRSVGGSDGTSATAEGPPPAPETDEPAPLGPRRSSLSDITTGSVPVSGSGSGSTAAPRRLLSLAFGPGPGAGAARHSTGDTRTERTERRARRRSLCPEELAAELSRSGRAVAPAVRRRMSRRPPGLPVLPEESTDAEWSPPSASAAAVAREEQWGW